MRVAERGWSPFLRYLAVCVVFFALAEWWPWAVSSRFYRFDRQHLFLPAFYAALFLLGVALGVHRARHWTHAAWLGALSGLLGGWVAQWLVMVLTTGNWPISIEWRDVALPLILGSIVWLTPVWGALAAVVSAPRALRKVVA